MQETNSRPQSETRFNLRQNEGRTGNGSQTQEKFLIRNEATPVAATQDRAQAIFSFDQETARHSAPTRQNPAAAKPGVATLLLNAELLLKAGERSAAAHLVRQALFLDSRHPEAIKKMIRCLGDQEWENKQRLTLRKTLLDIEPNFQNFFEYGQALVEAGEFDAALDSFFEANMRVKEEGEALFEVFKQMGNIYVRKGDFESAEEFYHKAYTLNPDSDILQVNLGTLSVQKQDWGTAIERFRRALELNSINDKAWVGLGLCYQQVGDSHLAQATLENALDICPANRTAVHLLASWSFGTDNVRGATVRLQDYLATQEMDIEMSLVLIHLFCELRQYSMASIELERALCWAPDREDLLNLRVQLQDQGVTR